MFEVLRKWKFGLRDLQAVSEGQEVHCIPGGRGREVDSPRLLELISCHQYTRYEGFNKYLPCEVSVLRGLVNNTFYPPVRFAIRIFIL